MHLKSLIKKLLRSSLCIHIVSWIAANYMRLVFRTNSWQFIQEEIPQAYWSKDKPFVGCFWHGRLAMMSFCWHHTSTVYMLISAHRDGQIITKSIGQHGIKTIVGSTSKGGSQALRSILKVLKSGHSIVITPDGPRGPRFKVNPGLIAIARMAKVDIVPGTFSIQRRIVWKSWDRLVFPLPFGRGVFVFGKPIPYTKLKDKNATQDLTLELEQRLNDISKQADALCGHKPIESIETDQEEQPCSS